MYLDYKKIGQRIATRRKELGYKQSEVTEMAGLSEKYLSNIERATSVLSVDVLMKLCDALNITPNELLLGTTTDADKNISNEYITNALKNLTPKQAEVALGFIEWIATQDNRVGGYPLVG